MSRPYYVSLAQSVERRTVNPQVVGSSPTRDANKYRSYRNGVTALKFEAIHCIKEVPGGNPLMGHGVAFDVSANGKPFIISVFVREGTLRAAYSGISREQVTHFRETDFVFDATGDIIDLLDTSTWETRICDVNLQEAPNVDLRFENVVLTLHICPSGGVEVETVSEPKSGHFS